MEWLSNASSIIILIGGVFTAINIICSAIGKPIKFWKKRADEEFEEKVVDILKKALPKLLETRDLQTRDKYLADRERYLNQIKSEVVTSIDGELNQVKKLDSKISSLEISAKDVLREKIVCMYETNKHQRRLKFFERKALNQYYKDYKAMGGNSYIDTIYSRMDTWEVEPDDYE